MEAKLLGRAEPGALPGDLYGHSIAISGDTMAVGVPEDATAAGAGAGSVLIFEREGGAWVQRQKVTLGSSGSLEGYRFGHAVALDGNVLAATSSHGDSGELYVFERQDGLFTQVAVLYAQQSDSSSGFGSNVAVSGATIVAGVPLANAPGADSGTVYAFVRSGSGTWSFQQKMTTQGQNAGLRLGTGVTVSGDTIIAGAPGASTTAVGTGAVMVYERSGGAWSLVYQLTVQGAAAGDALGTSVAYSGATLVAGAPGSDGPSGPVDRGAAYVFEGGGQAWSLAQRLLAANAAAGDAFGSTVATDGATALVGIPLADAGGIDRGAVDSFRRAGAGWGAPQRLTSPTGDALDWFGGALAVAGARAAVGAPHEDSPAGESVGAVYTFETAGGAWGASAALVPQFGTEGAWLGNSVDADGDTVIAGAVYASTATVSWSGYAYVFTRDGISWSEQQRLEPPDGAPSDFFGNKVALSGDVAAVGAPGRDGPASNTGAVYVYERAAGAWMLADTVLPPEPTDNAGFGSVLALSGDTLAVSRPGAVINGQDGRGRVDVFARSGGTWHFAQVLTAADGVPLDYFGQDLALDGDTLVVGAVGRAVGGVRTGAAYVFTRTAGTWSQGPLIAASDGTDGDQFGLVLSLDGDTLVVGVPNDDAAGLQAGSAYVFQRSGGTFVQQQRLLPAALAANSRFGGTVGLDGDLLVVHGPSVPPGGAGFTFHRDGARWVEGPRLVAPDATLGNGFEAFGVSADTIVAGMPRDDQPNAAHSGAAYVYRVQRSDVSVTLTNSQAATVPGTRVTYTLVAANAGIHPIATARVVSSAPATLQGVGWTCAGSGGGTCGAGGTGHVDDLPSLPVGGTATYTITADVDPAATGTLACSAVIVPPGDADPNPANNDAFDVDTLTPRTDLAVTLASVPTAVGSGAFITWTTDVTNLGASTSTGSSLRHDLAAHATVVSVSPGPPTCGLSASAVTCALGSLAPHASHRLAVVQRVDGAYLGSIVAQSAVTAIETDPVATNDLRQVEVEVIPPGDAELAHGSTLLTPMASGGARYRLSQRPFTSYEAVVDATSGDIGGANGPTLALATATSTVLLSTPIGVGPSRSLRWRNDSSVVVDDQYVRVTSLGCTTGCGAADAYRIRVYETTLRAARFNNVGAQGSVLILHNRGERPVAARASFWSTGGAPLATRDIDLAAGGSWTLPLATVVGIAGQSGSITIAHDAPYGVLAGKVVALEPSTGFSFDTPLASLSR